MPCSSLALTSTVSGSSVTLSFSKHTVAVPLSSFTTTSEVLKDTTTAVCVCGCGGGGGGRRGGMYVSYYTSPRNYALKEDE